MWEICDVQENVYIDHKDKNQKLESATGELGFKIIFPPYN